MSARKSPSLVNPNPSNLRSPQGRITASGCEGQQCAAHPRNARFQLLPSLRLATLLMRMKRHDRQMEAFEEATV
jgi:hypothetical protein